MSVERLQIDLEDGKRGCDDVCCTVLLGSIVKEKKKHNLRRWRVWSFKGGSLEALKNGILAFKSPIWYTGYGSSPHECTLVNVLRPDIDEIWASIEGFDVEDYVPIYERTTTVAT